MSGTVYYAVRYRLAGGSEVLTSTVAISPGYSTFESIRTILAVSHTGAQTPDAVEVLAVEKMPAHEAL